MSDGKGGVDRIFAERAPKIDDFDFGNKTAAVFDDMLDRSVPYYGEIQRMICEMVADFAQPGTRVYDLGCSTGTTLINIDRSLPADVQVDLVGLDKSPEMLVKAREKMDRAGMRNRFSLEVADLDRGVVIEDASIVLFVLTLQFIRPLNRTKLLETIHRGMRDNGCLILVEKVLGDSSTFNRLFIRYYYRFKARNDYSELEIAQKREALENVLIPYRLCENQQLLADAGFRTQDVFFKWNNFCGVIAMKTPGGSGG
jgi:tRNA (cmo5U34)-methyltransferase